MKIKFKTLSGKYIKIPADIIYEIEINRRVGNSNPYGLSNYDMPLDCTIKLLNGAGRIDIVIINQFDVMAQYRKFLNE